MLNHFIISGLTDSYLDLSVYTPVGIKNIRADKRVDARNADWTSANKHPVKIQTNKETYLIYKDGTFPAQVIYGRQGLYYNATVLDGQIVLIGLDSGIRHTCT